MAIAKGRRKTRRPQTVKKLIHYERKGTGQYFGLQPKPPAASGYLSGTWTQRVARVYSAEENPVFLRPDKVQGFPQK